ncbi:MAG: T9SS type A sorting domain-containing protein, partial [Bacteroidota bacterium]|nr:T9SS type A sorting domain-containing protein [Bacteroidota bacterium]
VKLNNPGQKNGIFEFWINDTLQASATNLDWHSTWNSDPNNLHINAVFFENYWNSGSPVDQERYFDNLVISTKPIPCSCQVTSTEKNPSTEGMVISPNPIQQFITLNIPVKNLPIPIVIYDLNGRIIFTKKITETKTSIDLSSFAPGVYLLKAAQLAPMKLLINK